MNVRKIVGCLLVVLIILTTSFASFAETHYTNYTIVKGDTLWRIGIKYGVSWGTLAELNGIKDVRKLQIGQVIRIPIEAEKETEEQKSTVETKPEEKPVAEILEHNYTETEIFINNGTYEVPAIVCIPKGEGPFPAVVMLHGTGSDKNEAGGGYKLLAPALAEAGIASIRIDFVGNGDSKEDYINYNYTTAVSDANTAFDYIAGIDKIDPNRIGIMGWSQGGTIAMLAAGSNRAFQSVLTWAGTYDLSSIGTEEAYEAAKMNGYYDLTFDWRSPLKLGLQWFEEMRSTDVLEVFSYSDAPILAINGSNDTVVDPAMAYDIVNASRNNNSKVLIIDGADHTFNIFTGDMTAFNKLIEATVDWFKTTLTPAYTVDEVMIENGNRQIPATIVVPVGDGPFPAVVMNHGHGGSRHENGGFAGIAEALANAGIASIRMDFPGCGDSTESFKENYLSNMISDSNASLEYLLSNYNIDKEKLGILGYSMGGRVAMHICTEENSPYIAMGLLAPSVDPGEEMMIRFFGGEKEFKDLYAEASSDKGYADFTTVFGQEQTLSKAWFDEMIDSKPLENIMNYNGSMLVIHGEKDEIVPASVIESIISAYKTAEKVIIAEADHGYGFYSEQPAVTATVEDSLVDFFVRSFK